VAPRTPLEEALAGIWSAVLGVEPVGVDDDFFALGGHSLRAMQVVARVRDVLRIELPIRRIFESPTIAGLTVGLVEEEVERVGSDLLRDLLAEVEQLPDAAPDVPAGGPHGETGHGSDD
jgi:acyl carrier protein